MRPRLSLKGRALQWLAQREHSRLELRRKLMRQARADLLARLAAHPTQAGDVHDSTHQPQADVDASAAGPAAASIADEVDALLDWLQSHRYLSEERFVESRVYARQSRFGNLRIRQELSQHAVELTADLSADLMQSEHERARAVRQRKFGDAAASLSDRARQARFLAGRGFSAEVIWQVLRELGDGATHDADRQT
jgi:regulatory protein